VTTSWVCGSSAPPEQQNHTNLGETPTRAPPGGGCPNRYNHNFCVAHGLFEYQVPQCSRLAVAAPPPTTQVYHQPRRNEHPRGEQIDRDVAPFFPATDHDLHLYYAWSARPRAVEVSHIWTATTDSRLHASAGQNGRHLRET
ncbi:unnamed protein product, partial [Amoebophrya sp. A120]